MWGKRCVVLIKSFVAKKKEKTANVNTIQLSVILVFVLIYGQFILSQRELVNVSIR